MICPTCCHDNVPGAETCDKCQCDLTPLDRPMGHDRIEQSLMEDTVGSLHPQEAITVLPTASIHDAIQAMLRHDIGALLVVDEEGQLLGIFSERDLLSKVTAAGVDLGTTPVSQFMTLDPECVSASDKLNFALHQMDIGGYRHLPLLDEGRPAGVVSVRDLLRHITRLC